MRYIPCVQSSWRLFNVGAVLVVLLAAVLCVLYASDTVIIANNYRFYDTNPPGSKLVLLAEVLKLFIATLLFNCSQPTGQHQAADHAKATRQQYVSDQRPSWVPRWLQQCWHHLPDSVQSLIIFSVPALCYCLTNK